MGASALRPKPTAHNGTFNKSSKFQEFDIPPSPVSPLDSNGETWKYPPSANTHRKELGDLNQIPLQEVPAKTRLSRPFEQPASSYTSEHRQASAQPALRQQPTQAPKKKTAPPPLTIPKAAHQPRRQHEPNPVPEDGQNDQTGVQRSARHQGWNPLKEPPRQQNAAQVPAKDGRHGHGRGRDLERQGKFTGFPKVKDRQGLVAFILWMVVGLLGIIALIVFVKTTWGKG